MSDVNGVNMAAVALNKKAAVGDVSGVVKALGDTYVFPADVFASANRIKIGTIPKGAKIVGGHISSDDLGSTGGFSLGTTDDADGIVTALTCTTTGGDRKSADGALLGTKMAADTDVYLVCTADTDSASGDTIRATVMYVKE